MSSLQDFIQSNRAKKQSAVASWWNTAAGSGRQMLSTTQIMIRNGLAAQSSGTESSSSNGDLSDVRSDTEGNNGSNGGTNKSGNGTQSSSSSWTGGSWFKSESAYGLSRTQRMVGFVMCLLAGLFCFVVASFYIPLLVFKARKFGALYSLGSCFFIFSFSLLWGPWNYIKHLFSASRLPVTGAYFGTLLATLYASLWIGFALFFQFGYGFEIRSTLLTIVCAFAQMFALTCYVDWVESNRRRKLRPAKVAFALAVLVFTLIGLCSAMFRVVTQDCDLLPKCPNEFSGDLQKLRRYRFNLSLYIF